MQSKFDVRAHLDVFIMKQFKLLFLSNYHFAYFAQFFFFYDGRDGIE